MSATRTFDPSAAPFTRMDGVALSEFRQIEEFRRAEDFKCEEATAESEDEPRERCAVLREGRGSHHRAHLSLYFFFTIFLRYLPSVLSVMCFQEGGKTMYV